LVRTLTHEAEYVGQDSIPRVAYDLFLSFPVDHGTLIPGPLAVLPRTLPNAHAVRLLKGCHPVATFTFFLWFPALLISIFVPTSNLFLLSGHSVFQLVTVEREAESVKIYLQEQPKMMKLLPKVFLLAYVGLFADQVTSASLCLPSAMQRTDSAGRNQWPWAEGPKLGRVLRVKGIGI
jgi:hypothetical protein